MKFIIGPRASGVSTDLILEASKFDEPIIVPNEASARYIKDICLTYEIPCPQTCTFREIKNANFFREKKLKQFIFQM